MARSLDSDRVIRTGAEKDGSLQLDLSMRLLSPYDHRVDNIETRESSVQSQSSL
jgi:hypothetical protein